MDNFQGGGSPITQQLSENVRNQNEMEEEVEALSNDEPGNVKIEAKTINSNNLMNYGKKTKAENNDVNLNLQNYMKHQEQLEKNLVNIKIQPKRAAKKEDLNKIDIVD